jgi:hypothetical protein
MADDEGIRGVREPGRDAAIVRVLEAVRQFAGDVENLKARLGGRACGVVAQATADAAGRPVRVQVAADTLGQVVDGLTARMRVRIGEASRCWAPRPWPQADREDAGPVFHIPPRCPPLTATDAVARIKQVRLAYCSAQAAAMTMDLMDYQAHLFRDRATGAEAAVFRSGPTGYTVTRLRAAAASWRDGVPLVTDPRPAPVCDQAHAVATLETTGLGHLFYADKSTGCGRLLYRRLDGYYGLLIGGA